MLGYQEKIKKFVEQNFQKGHPDVSEHWFTTPQVLAILFTGFPSGCIDEYELNDILEPKFERKLRIKEWEELEGEELVTYTSDPAVYWIIKIEEKP